MQFAKDNKGRVRRILSLEEVERMDEAQKRLLKLGGAIFPVAGASPDDDEEEDDAEKEEREKREREERERKEREEREKKDKGGDDKGGDGDDDDEYVRIPKDEAARLRRENREARDKERERERKEKEREEKDKAEKGRWEEIAQDREKERDAAIKERDDAQEELQSYKRQQRVTKIAQRLMFIDPADAHLYISNEEMDDDDRTERALKRVLREKKHLKSNKAPTGVPAGGGGNGGGLTFEQIKNMSQDELINRKDEVDAALAAMGREMRDQ
jgi:hypothetical protein